MKTLKMCKLFVYFFVLILGLQVSWSIVTPQIANGQLVGGVNDGGCCDNVNSSSNCESHNAGSCTRVVQRCITQNPPGTLNCTENPSRNASSCFQDTVNCQARYHQKCGL
jgi:hypothetical protein